MALWQRAEEILSGIESDLNQTPPKWDDATRSTEHLIAMLPGAPPFQAYKEGQATEVIDIRIARLRTDLDQLILGSMKRNWEDAMRSVYAALRNVQALGRKRS